VSTDLESGLVPTCIGMNWPSEKSTTDIKRSIISSNIDWEISLQELFALKPVYIGLEVDSGRICIEEYFLLQVRFIRDFKM
jgi:hypothetical protein